MDARPVARSTEDKGYTGYPCECWHAVRRAKHVRCGKLYLPGGGDRFASRKAWRLGYHSQRVAHRDRAFEKLFRLQRKLAAGKTSYIAPSACGSALMNGTWSGIGNWMKSAATKWRL